MNRERLLKMFRKEKVQDLSFNIFFFLAFSIFIIFAIRPNLLTAFGLQQQLQDLKLKNKQAEEEILEIVNYQTVLEERRDSLFLLDDAIPSKPRIAHLISQLNQTATDSGLILDTVAVESIPLKRKITLEKKTGGEQDSLLPANDSTAAPDANALSGEGDILSYTITFSGSASWVQIHEFIEKLFMQRRLKTYDSLTISANSDQKSITIIVRTYYL